MLGLGLRAPLGTLLCLGAHSDDAEIGCGGTVLRLLEEHPAAHVVWVVLAASGERREEAVASARRLLGNASCEIVVEAFRDGFLPHDSVRVKERFEALKEAVSPDLILTHTRDDMHQDHRLVNELTWNTWRSHLILEYEIPKVDGDLGRPNLYVPLTAEQVERKVAHLLEAFPSQRGKHWFDAELFRGLMRLRGMEAVSPSGYAEAFVARKLVL
ncbi:MAG: PIG-L deacetylase family protein [Thermoleophilia bacterium]